jgi:hypothetical protein
MLCRRELKSPVAKRAGAVMTSESTTEPPPTCRTCGTTLSDMRDDSDVGDGPEGVTLLYCLECQRGVCPFCGQTDDCPHFVAFSRSGDFSGSSLGEWLPHRSKHGHYLHVMEVEEDWHLLDRLIEELAEPVITIEFDAWAHWNVYHYAQNGSELYEALATRARQEYAEALHRKGNQDDVL